MTKDLAESISGIFAHNVFIRSSGLRFHVHCGGRSGPIVFDPHNVLEGSFFHSRKISRTSGQIFGIRGD